jgi:hypothetical protein
LLDDRDDRELLRLDAQIEEAERLARTHRDRVRLLEGRAAQEERERVAVRRRDLIERNAKKLAERDSAGAELQKTLATADAQFRKLIELTTEVAMAWSWEAPQIHAAALSPATIKTLVAHEIFRVGARPFLGGRPGESPQQDFPGGQSPSLQLRGQPEKITPLADALREASTFAGRVMRGEIVTPQPAPAVSEKTAAAPALPQQPPAEPARLRSASEIQAGIPKLKLL